MDTHFKGNCVPGLRMKPEEVGEDQRRPKMHQRCCSTIFRRKSPPHKSMQALLFATGGALLKDERPMGLPFRREPRFEKELP